MNKGLEVIEAKWLFGVSVSCIEVVVHPQSIIHSMVAYQDGSVLAQMGVPDMRGAISYALSYPERLDIGQPLPDFFDIAALTFRKPDMQKFPCLRLAFEACRAGSTYPAVLNAANEMAVYAFLDAGLSFPGIPAVIEETLAAHSAVSRPAGDDILQADEWAREKAAALIRSKA
jgi:1-deoxy-D-xylulose-5-phosphate reductoisomerase